MSDFVITEVHGEPRPWTHKESGNRYLYYDISFEGDQGRTEPGQTASWKTKADDPPPTSGQTVDAEIVHKNGKVELKPVRKGGWGGGGGANKNDHRTPEQIMRSDAHGKAMHWCDIKVAAGEWQPITWEQYIAMVNRYYEDIKAAS